MSGCVYCFVAGKVRSSFDTALLASSSDFPLSVLSSFWLTEPRQMILLSVRFTKLKTKVPCDSQVATLVPPSATVHIVALIAGGGPL